MESAICQNMLFLNNENVCVKVYQRYIKLTTFLEVIITGFIVGVYLIREAAPLKNSVELQY